MTTVPYPDGLSGQRRALALATKGFMPPDEGDALHAAALAAAQRHGGAPLVEIGTYCGRSTVWLGDAAERCGTTLFTIDHHHGSEENQAGWFHHDADVVDALTGRMDTLPFLRRTLGAAGLEASVVAVVGASPTVARHWTTPCAFVFIDGGHGVEHARADYESWSTKVMIGGTLAIHDVFPDPADGGRPPYEQIYLPALRSKRFIESGVCGSLRLLTALC